jgi:hypothetical protein
MRRLAHLADLNKLQLYLQRRESPAYLTYNASQPENDTNRFDPKWRHDYTLYGRSAQITPERAGIKDSNYERNNYSR